MAASSWSCTNLVHNKSHDSHQIVPINYKHGECSFGRPQDLRCLQRATRRRDLVVRKLSPEAAGDLVSSLSIPGLPGFSLPVDNPWLAGVAGLLVGVPFMIQRLIALSKGVDMAAETVEKIADVVGKVAHEVDKAAEDIVESLPEGGLKKMVQLVEDVAEETVKDAQMVEDLMDKVEELDDKLEAFLEKQSKGTDKA